MVSITPGVGVADGVFFVFGVFPFASSGAGVAVGLGEGVGVLAGPDVLATEAGRLRLPMIVPMTQIVNNPPTIPPSRSHESRTVLFFGGR
nr:hypothetical protein [uncultured bacterium]